MNINTVLVRRVAAAIALLGIAVLKSAPLVEAAPPAPVIQTFDVRAGGTEVTFKLTTSQPTILSYSAVPVNTSSQPAAPPRRPIIDVFGGSGALPTISTISPQNPASYTLQHEYKIARLKPGTPYTLKVTATTAAGGTVERQMQFTTLKQRIRLTLDRIVVHEDGDWLGSGEPTWFWEMKWTNGATAGCYPYTGATLQYAVAICQDGSVDAGTVLPKNPSGGKITHVLAQENLVTMPTQLTLSVDAKENDWHYLGAFANCLENLGCPFSITAPAAWDVPQGVEWASKSVVLEAIDSGTGFKSTMYFHIDLFHDNLTYAPNHGSRTVHTTW